MWGCSGFMVGYGIWRIESNGVGVREEWLKGMWILVQIRVWVYDNGDVFWVGGGVESTPMYCLL